MFLCSQDLGTKFPDHGILLRLHRGRSRKPGRMSKLLVCLQRDTVARPTGQCSALSTSNSLPHCSSMQPHTSSLSHTDVHPDCLGSFPTLGICPYSCQPEYLRQSCGQDSPLTLVQGYCLSIRLFFIVLFPFFLCSVNLIFIFFIVRNQTRCLVRVG